MEPNNNATELVRVIREGRAAKGMSLRRLADAAGLTHSFVAKLEAGRFQRVSPRTLDGLAKALDIRREDLYSLAGYDLPEEMPAFGPYLRARYGEELPEQALATLDELFSALRAKYPGSGVVDDESDDPAHDPGVHGHVGGTR